MSLLQSILMGIIQGATEFLPVSSSGHLALFKIIFNVNTETGLLFDTMLHLGTLVAVCIVYWKDVCNLIVQDHIRIVRHALGHNVLALKKIDFVIVYTNIPNVFCDLHK